EHIKEVGEYDVEVRLYKDVKAEIKVVVVSEDVIVEDKDQSTEESQSNDNTDSESK
ncbi:MAG: 50S ribosomal protein L9, partial [Actinobacteria bacterium]|nr:50S ribosomal protein L9 [Actinomycetota bacterium]